MNTPHTHPRATEMLYLVNGTLETGMLDENGARFVYNTINAGSAAVFLKGSIHYQLNLGCEPVQFVAALNDEDPGTLSIAQRYFGLPPDIVGASLGDLGVQEVAGLEKARCNINRGTQPTTQRQPRVSGNALPSGFSGPTPAAPAPSATATHARRALADAAIERRTEVSQAATTTPEKVVFTIPEFQIVSSIGQNIVNLALLGLVAFMASGYVVIAVLYTRQRGRAAALPVVVAERFMDIPSEKSAL
ncbi:hypothetical protein EIP91_006674 [Steccherinum ochraceum]|uniref:Cupin type-1 domain-containing protein n=1 Tax=Steccherinum ochraceum TaxID=92696 RepID=A0A4V2MXD1_9APHY|nr:hypothetical protein EIP91_006674 [Steccherinum ochraceum]